MTDTKTAGNQPETHGYEGYVIGRLDHMDETLHDIQRTLAGIQSFIDEHRPALARGLSLMDPGAAARKFMGMKPRKPADG